MNTNDTAMFKLSFIFLVITVMIGVFLVTMHHTPAAPYAQVLFLVAMALFVLSLIIGAFTRVN